MSITLLQALENIKPFIGKELSQYTKQFGITIISANGGYNKGWKGQVVEKLAGLNGDNKQAPNGLGFECKSTAFVVGKDQITAKETMAITMFDEKDFDCLFLESHFWAKLKVLIFCAISWDGPFSSTGTLLKVSTFQTLDLDEGNLYKRLESDYNLIIDYFKKCKSNGTQIHTISGELVQVRTKGSKSTMTRAFYAQKQFVNQIFNND